MASKPIHSREKILIVEDEHLIAKDLERKIKEYGFSTLVAHNGEDAIKIIENQRPDLVLMDIILEGDISGIEVIEIIQKKFPVPVIYLTSYVDDETVSQAKLTMPLGYIVKPYNEVELRASIELALYKSKMEEKYYESEKKYRDLVEKAQIAILIDDFEGNFRYCNSYFSSILGYQQNEIYKMSLQDLVYPEDYEDIMAYHQARVSGKSAPKNYIKRFVHKNGSVKYLEINSSPFEENDEIIGTKSYIWDNTERILMQQKIEEEDEIFRSITEQSNDGIMILNQKGEIIQWNRGQEKITGYTKTEVIGRQYNEVQYQLLLDNTRTKETYDFIANNLKDFFINADAEWLGKLQEISIKDKSGGIKHVQQMPFIITTSRGFLLCNITRDVTAQHEAYNMLKKSEENYRRLFESSSEAILISDLEDRILKANPAAAKMLGYRTPVDMIGVNIKDFYLNPDERTLHLDYFKKNGFVKNYKIKMKKMDGSNEPITIVGSANLIENDDGDEIAEAMFINITLFEK